MVLGSRGDDTARKKPRHCPSGSKPSRQVGKLEYGTIMSVLAESTVDEAFLEWLEDIPAYCGAFADSGMRHMNANDDKSRGLAASRDTLLPQLLPGRTAIGSSKDTAL